MESNLLYRLKSNWTKGCYRKLLNILLVVLVNLSCINSNYIYNEGFIQGTTYRIIYENPFQIDYHEDIKAVLSEFDMSLSTYNKNSLISRINKNEDNVILDKYFKEVFNKSKEIYHKTDGAFDITLAPIINLWGFGSGSMLAKKDSSVVDSLLQYVGLHKIEIQDDRLKKENKEIELNVNAIAQGYSVDIVCEFLEKKGIHNYLVEIGGEIKTKGVNKRGKIWTVGIDKPIDNNLIPGQDLQAIIKLNNSALATSGNYRKFYEENGVKFSHTIDPKTGYPARNRLLSATVISSDCITADAWATSFMVLGLEKSKLLLQKYPELEVYFVYSNDNGKYEIFQTKGIHEILEEAN